MSISNVQVTFYGGLFDMIEHAMLHTKGAMSSKVTHANNDVIEPNKATTIESTSKHNSLSRIDKLITRLTPHVATIHVEQIEIKSLNKQSSYHYHLLLYTINGKIKKFKSSDDDFSDSSSISYSAKAKLSNLRIYTPAQEVLSLKELTADMRSNGNVIKAALAFDTIDAVYNDEDIYGWFLKIFTAGMKSSRKEMILRAIEMGNRKMIEFYHSEFVRAIFNRIVFNGSIELRHVVLTLQLDDHISSINAMKIKLSLHQSDKQRELPYTDYTMDLLFKTRHWSMDALSEGSLCWFMGSKYPCLLSGSDNKQQPYIRGSALFMGNFFTRVCSQKDDFKINLRVNTFRMEYSNKLTNFILQSIKCYKAFTNLFSQLRSKKKESHSCEKSSTTSSSLAATINVKEFLQKFTINLKIVDISCFFINRHDVCTFVNVSNATSTDNFNYTLETLRVSTVDFSKYDGLCDLSEFSTTYISTCLLKINLEMGEELPQLCVDFAEKLDCSWNAHFLRHSLSIIRDFRRFKRNIEDALEIDRTNTPLLPRSLPVGLDLKKLRNIRVKHADVNVDKLFLLINELSGENLFFYNYFH